MWTDAPHIEILAPMLPLCYHSTDIAMRARAARYFGAAKKAVLKLKEYYSEGQLVVSKQLDRTFPFPTEYVPLGDSNTRPFKYQNQLSSDKLLFCGLAGDDVICIKFTRRYSKDAHLKCASLGFAPTLRGFESLPGGWFMAVMDLLGDDYQLLSERRDRAQFCEEIQTKVSDLHQAGFVHGDIRPTNVMVKKSGPPGVMLLDFDWAGVIGEARYPMNVSAGHQKAW